MIPLTLLLLFGLLAAAAAVVVQLSSMLLHPARMTDGKALYLLRRMSPSDLGLAFEPRTYTVRDERDGQSIALAGWWIGADPTVTRTCVLIHGYGDAKVGAIAWAPMLHALGWHVLAIDLRAHGESGGRCCTGGDRETDDLAQAIARLRDERPAETATLALFGISLGGAVALATAARGENRIAAVIAESTFADFIGAAMTHARLIGAPAPVLHRLAVRFGIWRAAARPQDVRPVDSVIRCPCPIQLIHGLDDPFVPAPDREALAAALAARANPRDDLYVIAGAGHCMGMAVEFEAYRARVAAFLQRATDG